ncbi:7-deoxyloganetin glucosyltransferase [Hibiscus syriacus]|uniref:Glycosyltransferase n=1 Tax=Hibiscus syriacus TaxID=106335 RepID=A0A6A3AVQ9_HIBSY|nr:linamarin synthase 2-like [Hibiscus syriacus]KAE8706962.1 7-deoxyloganetin glucosyltransferase [Hibiscus syriacus]
MASTGSTKSHAVFLPFPSQGHINPMMQLAKLLHSRGFHITFVNSEYNHRRFIRSRGEEAIKGLPDFRFETIPDGLPPSDSDATQSIPAVCHSQRTCLAPFLELLSKLNSSPESPPVTCIVYDGIMNFGTKAAQVIRVPYVVLWTSSPVSLLGYLQYKELIQRGIVPFKDEDYLSDGTLEMPIDIPGMPIMRLKDIPSFIRTTDPNDIMLNFIMEASQECLKSSIILNTFDEFDKEVLRVLADKSPNVYAIGPLASLSRNINTPGIQHDRLYSSLWKEDTSCIEWLNTKEPNSVVYVNYGSITVMSNHHLKEFAWGLANSKYPFLWIVRPDVVIGESAVLPEEFTEEIKGRGFITSWCPQQQVLSHPAIGLFLTHCGWNSLLEAVTEGVPLICWPFFADQQTNCRYSCTTWGIAMEINPDVKRNDVETLVREMMEGDNGKMKRKKAMKWKTKAEAAVSTGGYSLINFDRMIKETLRHG